ncbi:hypothetical protein FNN87_26540, partial [Salmonella enterica subsp. diarizonae]|nr:hypothetical protein [Salmonella enterica subsp. diarizonae]ECF5952041.1 hypothetical protein [Salmonella enterica subsp. diarizonae]
RINAERHERTEERETWRNGYRDRQYNTRLGTLELRIGEHNPLLGAVLTEQNEEWLLQNRYLPQHTMVEIDQTPESEVIEALPLSA